MHHNHFEAIRTIQRLGYNLSSADHDAVDVSVHPPFTDLRSIQTVLEADDIPIALGAQHCHWEESGSFTGEVSPAMLAKLNVSLVIVGHSERRQIFSESDEDVNLKVQAVLAHGMAPIVCVGETLEEREAGATLDRVADQLSRSLTGVNHSQASNLVVAYEPIWAIGTGRTATPEDAQEVCSAIRRQVGELWNTEVADGMRIQYGGSVKPVSAPDLMRLQDVDGLLVGGGSLDPDEFARIVAYRLVG